MQDNAVQATLPVDEETCADSYADCDSSTTSCIPELITRIEASLFNVGVVAMAGTLLADTPPQIDIADLMRRAEEKLIAAKFISLKTALSSYYEQAMTSYKRIETFAVSTGQIKLQLLAMKRQVDVLQDIILHATEFEEADAERNYRAEWLVGIINEIGRKTSKISITNEHSDPALSSIAEFIRGQALEADLDLQRAGVIDASSPANAEAVRLIEQSYRTAAALARRANNNFNPEIDILEAHFIFLTGMASSLLEAPIEAEDKDITLEKITGGLGETQAITKAEETIDYERLGKAKTMRAGIEKIFAELDDTLRLQSQKLLAEGKYLDFAEASAKRARIILEAAKLDALYWDAGLLENGKQFITFRYDGALAVLNLAQKRLSSELEKTESTLDQVAILTRLANISRTKLRVAIERYKVFKTPETSASHKSEEKKSEAANEALLDEIERYKEDFLSFLSRKRLVRYSDKKEVALLFIELEITPTTENLIEDLATRRASLYNELRLRGVEDDLYNRLVVEAQVVQNEQYGIREPRVDWRTKYWAAASIVTGEASAPRASAERLKTAIEQLESAKKEMIAGGQYDESDVIGLMFHLAKAMRFRSQALQEMQKHGVAGGIHAAEIRGAQDAALRTHIDAMKEYKSSILGEAGYAVVGVGGGYGYEREVLDLLRLRAGEDPAGNPDREDYRQLMLLQAKAVEADDIRTAWGQSWLLRAFRTLGTDTEPIARDRNALMATLTNGETDTVLEIIFERDQTKIDKIKSTARDHLAAASERARGSKWRPDSRDPAKSSKGPSTPFR